jgi:AAA15 family ATPase/GTPase
MICLEEVELQNVVVHKHTVWRQKESGIYVIRGENRSGKSLVFSALHNLEYARHPADNQRNRAKTLLENGVDWSLLPLLNLYGEFGTWGDATSECEK